MGQGLGEESSNPHAYTVADGDKALSLWGTRKSPQGWLLRTQVGEKRVEMETRARK